MVAETEHTLAFLDRSPLFKGHTLVVPREHVVTLRDLPDRLVAPFFTEVRRIAAAVQDGCEADGIVRRREQRREPERGPPPLPCGAPAA